MSQTRVHQRRGSAVFEFFHQMGWVPSEMVLVGVGVKPDEAIRAKELWPDVEITGFEPNLFSYNGLWKLFPGMILPWAISNERGQKTLHFRHSWKNGSSLTKSNSANQSAEVKCIRLDDGDAPQVQNAFLWLDCEGSELNVLQGAKEFLKNVQAINVEMTGRPREEGWPTPLEIHDFLVSHGYFQIYVHTIRTVVAQFDSIYVRGDLFRPELSTNLESVHRWLDWKKNQK